MRALYFLRVRALVGRSAPPARGPSAERKRLRATIPRTPRGSSFAVAYAAYGATICRPSGTVERALELMSKD